MKNKYPANNILFALFICASLAACATKLATPSNQFLVDATVNSGQELAYNSKLIQRGLVNPYEEYHLYGLNITSERKALLAEIADLSENAREGFVAGKYQQFEHDLANLLGHLGYSVALNQISTESSKAATMMSINNVALPKTASSEVKQVFTKSFQTSSAKSDDPVVAFLSGIRDTMKFVLGLK